MRNYYIFQIQKEFYDLNKENPYNLYRIINNIRKLKPQDLSNALSIYELIAKPFNKNKLNDYIYNNYKDNINYTKYNNKHSIYNYYTDEEINLHINKSFLLMNTTNQYPCFLKELKKYTTLFVVDFDNHDYFFLSSV